MKFTVEFHELSAGKRASIVLDQLPLALAKLGQGVHKTEEVASTIAASLLMKGSKASYEVATVLLKAADGLPPTICYKGKARAGSYGRTSTPRLWVGQGPAPAAEVEQSLPQCTQCLEHFYPHQLKNGICQSCNTPL